MSNNYVYIINAGAESIEMFYTGKKREMFSYKLDEAKTYTTTHAAKNAIEKLGINCLQVEAVLDLTKDF